ELVESGFVAYREERIGDAIELFKSAVAAALSSKPPAARVACQALANLSGLCSLRGDWEGAREAISRMGEIIHSHGLHDSLQHLELLECLAELRANQEDVKGSMGLRQEAVAMA